MLAVFQLEYGEVHTSTRPGVHRLPQWTGEGKVRQPRWMDMETMEVIDSMLFGALQNLVEKCKGVLYSPLQAELRTKSNIAVRDYSRQLRGRQLRERFPSRKTARGHVTAHGPDWHRSLP